MSVAKKGDTVKVHYTGTLEDGTVFDSSKDREPLQVKLGDKQVIAGFGKAVAGMKVGESKSVTIPKSGAYGDYNKELCIELPRENLDTEAEPKVGQRMQLERENGEAIEVSITKVSAKSITVDANHPLAGEDLNFEIELVGIS